MNWIRNLTIKWKLMLIIMMTSMIVLTLISSVFIWQQRENSRKALVADLKALAQVVGNNTGAAVVFNDADSAKQTLTALKTKGNILVAAIYLKEGNIFTKYVKEGVQVPMLPPVPPQGGGYLFQENNLSVYEPIQVEKDVVGSVYLLSDLKELTNNLKRNLMTVLIVLGISMVIGFIISSILQRIISVPLVQFAKTIRTVSDKQDYSIRVKNRYHDEIGELMQGFDQMLNQIQERDLSLTKAHDELEARVEERTHELKEQIQERQEAEVQLQKKTEELANSNKELEQFAYIASHDLQEPLRMVASYVQLLQRRYKDKLDKDAEDFINYAVDGSRRMQNLINDLLAYSRVGTKGKPLEPTDANKCLQDSLFNLQGALQDSGGSVTHDSLPILMADPVQLTQLFQNLIGNGLKYRGDRIPKIHVGLKDLGDEWQIGVKDNGIGIDPKYFDRIFVIFQRLHTKEEYAGTGIGLSVCKKIVERHKGRIWVESIPGEGATFLFTIPKIKEVA
ncbi:MAG: HAMP domain-containing protein [Deltaproteobacteria bacterium]|nr:HAMP domain-containing protein [Deltaproteobacteria bacterium]